MAISRAVQQDHVHIINRGDPGMEKKYDATYHFGKVVVHVVAPAPMTESELERRKQEYYRTGWIAWNSLSDAAKLQLNAKYEQQ